VRTLRDGGCAPLTVVLGAAEVDVDGARTAHNPDWPTGMGSSLRVGLAALAADPDAADATGVVVSLVDQPLLGPDVVARLLAAHAAGAAIAVATYGGKRRNPVLLARETWPEVARLAEGDAGARPYLAAHPEEITAVPCDDIGAPDDIDTAEDLARLRNAPPP
jgi:nicotine blue oxidoreductase